MIPSSQFIIIHWLLRYVRPERFKWKMFCFDQCSNCKRFTHKCLEIIFVCWFLCIGDVWMRRVRAYEMHKFRVKNLLLMTFSRDATLLPLISSLPSAMSSSSSSSSSLLSPQRLLSLMLLLLLYVLKTNKFIVFAIDAGSAQYPTPHNTQIYRPCCHLVAHLFLYFFCAAVDIVVPCYCCLSHSRARGYALAHASLSFHRKHTHTQTVPLCFAHGFFLFCFFHLVPIRHCSAFISSFVIFSFIFFFIFIFHNHDKAYGALEKEKNKI